MKSKALEFMLFAVVLSTFSVAVLANGGGLRFNGQMVNTGCDVRPLAQGADVEGMQLVQVSLHVRLAVTTGSDACGGGLIPFQAAYSKAPGAPATVSTEPATNQLPHGIVTLTYQ